MASLLKSAGKREKGQLNIVHASVGPWFLKIYVLFVEIPISRHPESEQKLACIAHVNAKALHLGTTENALLAERNFTGMTRGRYIVVGNVRRKGEGFAKKSSA